MNVQALSYWQKAKQALEDAKTLLPESPDGSASRSFYAGFLAVSALFALTGKRFRKHTELEAAVHRELIKTGRWPRELGTGYTYLLKTRATADYGDAVNVTEEEATQALNYAEAIVGKVGESFPLDV